MHHTNKVGHLPRSYASSPPQTGRAVHGFSKRVQEAELEGDARAGWRKSWPAGADDGVKEVVTGLRIRAKLVENPLMAEVVGAGHREERIRAGRHWRLVYNGGPAGSALGRLRGKRNSRQRRRGRQVSNAASDYHIITTWLALPRPSRCRLGATEVLLIIGSGLARRLENPGEDRGPR